MNFFYSKLFFRLIMVALFAVFIFSSFRAVIGLQEYRLNAKLNADAERFVSREESPDANNSEANLEQSNEEVKETNEIINVDFEQLKGINNEITSWIYMEGTGVNFPILQAEDNAKYINTAFNGEKSSLGSIFIDYRNDGNFSDRNTIIYGHAGKNGAMFGNLKQLLDDNFFKMNSYFYIAAEGKISKYLIFSSYMTDAYSDTYTLSFEDDTKFAAYLSAIKEKSYYETGITPDFIDKIVTLSTCSNQERDERVVIHGVLER